MDVANMITQIVNVSAKCQFQSAINDLVNASAKCQFQATINVFIDHHLSKQNLLKQF